MASAHQAPKKATVTMISPTEAKIEREFHAPRDLVWRAHTEPDLVKKWLGPRRFTTRIEQMDVRPGGKWHFVHVDADGTEYAFRGEYQEVVRPKLLSQTWMWDGAPEAGSFERMTLTERHGVTTVSVVAKYQKAEHVQMHMENGMEEGMNESYERLDELLATLA